MKTVHVLFLALLALVSQSHAQLAITEAMSSASTNKGPNKGPN